MERADKICGISTVVVRDLPKVEARVQFSYPAHKYEIQKYNHFLP